MIYIKTLKYELKSFIETQKRNHFLNRLKLNINQMINESIDIFRTRDAFAARTTRINNACSKNFDQNNHEADFNQTSQTINFFLKNALEINEATIQRQLLFASSTTRRFARNLTIKNEITSIFNRLQTM